MNNIEIVGSAKTVDEIKFEEAWMKRIEKLEEQYDSHVMFLQKNLLDERINKRLIQSLREHNLRLKSKVQELSIETQGLNRRLIEQETDLKFYTRQKEKLQSQLLQSKVKTKEQYAQIRDSDRNAAESKRKKDLIERQVHHTTSEKREIEAKLKEKELQLEQKSKKVIELSREHKNLASKLTQLQGEKETMARAKENKKASVNFFLVQKETDEERIYRMKHELQDLMNELRGVKIEEKESKRREDLAYKRLVSVEENFKSVLSKLHSTAQEALIWKQEAQELKEQAKMASISTQTKTKSEQLKSKTKTRSEDIELKSQINSIEKRQLEMEKSKTLLMSQMKTLGSLHKSLIRIHLKNEEKRKIFEMKNNTHKEVPPFAALSSSRSIQENHKKIEKLETELIKSRRAYNYLKFKLENKSDLEKKLKFTESALFDSSREKKRMETVGQIAARKLGANSELSLLKKSLLSQIEEIENLRLHVPSQKTDAFSDKKINGNFEEELEKIQLELRGVERKQAVYNNIIAHKEALEEEERMRRKKEEEESRSGSVSRRSSWDPSTKGQVQVDSFHEKESSEDSQNSEDEEDEEYDDGFENNSKVKEPNVTKIISSISADSEEGEEIAEENE